MVNGDMWVFIGVVVILQSSQALRKNVKAALTTVLILGTYIIGWMPATLFNIIACEDCIIDLNQVR